MKSFEETRALTACHTKLGRGAVRSRRFAIFIAISFATNIIVLAQSIPSGRTRGPRRSALLRTHHKFKRPSSPSLLTPLRPQTQEAPYQSLTPRQSLRWFTTNTMDPANLVGGILESALGTAPNRPKESVPHWGGFAERYGMGMTRNVTGNAIEAGVGLILKNPTQSVLQWHTNEFTGA